MHLNKEQLEAVRHKDGPMLVLAGPGSGKTAVLTAHIRFLIDECRINPEQILALTFSKKAAQQMRYRLGPDLPVCFGTFHSVFYSVLQQYKNAGVRLATDREKYNLLFDIGRKLQDGIDGAWVMTKLDEIGAFKNTGKVPDYFDAEEERCFCEILDAYQRRMHAAGLIDFEDMILDCLELLLTHPKILLKLQDRFSHILVDEFQDCNDPQYELLLLLGGKSQNLFCVGDDDQSIYGFRGANSGIIARLMKDCPHLAVVHLIRNYRCGAAVIDASDKLIRVNTLRLEKPKQLPSKFRERGSVAVLMASDARMEARIVCARIRSLLLEGVKACDIAILYRTEMCAMTLKEVLSKERLIDASKKENTFYEYEAVQEVMAYLSLSQNDYRREFFYRILNHPNRDLVRECVTTDLSGRDAMLHYYQGDEIHMRAVENLFSDLAFIGNLPPYAAVCYIWKKIGLGKDYEEKRLREKREDLPSEEEMLIRLLEHAGSFGSIRRFVEHAARKRLCKEEHGSARSEMEPVLQTIHAAKGLEYDTVFVIGLQEGILPHIRAKGKEEKEEERRLLYVAMTRARNRLYLIARGKKERGKRYSSFIDEIRA